MKFKSDSLDYRQSHLEKGADYDADLSAGDFNSYMICREQYTLQQIVPKLYPDKIPKYLDFACGTGRITMVVEEMAVISMGVDLFEKMLTEARKKCERTRFILVNLLKVASI